MNCRHCQAPLDRVLIDLGHQPASNAYLTPERLETTEVYAPLKTYVCEACWLVQLPSFHRSDELFTPDYAYFSSVSSGWVDHARRYVAAMVNRFGLTAEDWVVEIASNDGYLLQFVQQAGIRCTGIEPTASTAAASRALGIETLERFFGVELARELVAERGHASLTAANNVLAHVPDINDFVEGFAVLLAPDGVSTFEFPHLVNLIDQCQFDTIYHEHYSYLSLTAVQRIFAAKGLRVFDVEQVPTHGGSLRIFVCHDGSARHVQQPAVANLLASEAAAGITGWDYYATLANRALKVKLDLVEFLVAQKKAGKVVAAYGAAAKGNTLLNYAGVHADLVDFVCDAAPSKQGQFLPGSHIPILPPAALYERKPDLVLILPWNLRDEITRQHGGIAEWGGRFVVAIPNLQVL
ncbi:methyltransferase domain-containing protein [Novosphingobium flavum]|uniref:class I SAM-dependent methyltransferase n=1 Tax=Novosphingobium aerophilum TaxID=2839843 RepID=UPI001639B4CC|nr:class I SAM-dependent methyltransferase [Novosphingobium aerophilum]MBC2661987.1 methyltransferase domain-containing protein [Novosphingobium aerophilum]